MSIVKTHENVNPEHRAQTDFAIAARVRFNENDVDWEQLWVKQLSDDLFRVCCIPFWVDGVSLGDVVLTGLLDVEQYVVHKVVEKSGHRTLRVWLSGMPLNDLGDEMREDFAHAVTRLGGMIEFFSRKYAAIDAPNEPVFSGLCAELERRERALQLDWAAGDAG